jgi:hypothetical protein
MVRYWRTSLGFVADTRALTSSYSGSLLCTVTYAWWIAKKCSRAGQGLQIGAFELQSLL